MKKRFLTLVCVCAMVCLCASIFVACDDGNAAIESSANNNSWSAKTVFAQAQVQGYDGTFEEFIQQLANIKEVAINEDGELVFTLGDDTQVNAGTVVGEDGENGIDGEQGADGENGFSVFIAYSEFEDGAEFTEEVQSESQYIGFASAGERPTDKSDYVWSRFVGAPGEAGADGAQGIQGIQGIQGERGEDGVDGVDGEDGDKVFVAYSNSKIGMSYVTDPGSTAYYYMGIAIGQEAPADATGYVWVRIMGTKGATGLTGATGAKGADGASVYIAYSDKADGEGYINSFFNGAKYMGVCVSNTAPTAKTDFNWILFVCNDRDCTVTFNSDGAGTIANAVVGYGEYLATMPIPEKEGFVFAGWFTTTDGEITVNDGQVTKTTVINSDLAVKAKWLEA